MRSSRPGESRPSAAVDQFELNQDSLLLAFDGFVDAKLRHPDDPLAHDTDDSVGVDVCEEDFTFDGKPDLRRVCVFRQDQMVPFSGNAP